jgi:hypothetical protein
VSLSIIGEDKTLSIKVGAEAGDPSTRDIIMIRGPSSDVDHAVQRIHRIVEEAKNHEIVNSYVSTGGPSRRLPSDPLF